MVPPSTSMHHRPPPLKNQPAIMRVHWRYLEPATLEHYRLVWRWDPYDEGYLLFKPWLSKYHQEKLFEHTRKIRAKDWQRQIKEDQQNREVLEQQKRIYWGSDTDLGFVRDKALRRREQSREMQNRQIQYHDVGERDGRHHNTRGHRSYGSTTHHLLHQDNHPQQQQPSFFTPQAQSQKPATHAPLQATRRGTTPARYLPNNQTSRPASVQPGEPLPEAPWQGPVTPGAPWSPRGAHDIFSRPASGARQHDRSVVDGWRGLVEPGKAWSPRFAQVTPLSPMLGANDGHVAVSGWCDPYPIH